MGELIWHQPCNELSHHLCMIIYSLDGEENLSEKIKCLACYGTSDNKQKVTLYFCGKNFYFFWAVKKKPSPFGEHEMRSQSSSTPQKDVCTAGLFARGIFLFWRMWRRGSTCREHHQCPGGHQWMWDTCHKRETVKTRTHNFHTISIEARSSLLQRPHTFQQLTLLRATEKSVLLQTLPWVYSLALKPHLVFFNQF